MWYWAALVGYNHQILLIILFVFLERGAVASCVLRRLLIIEPNLTSSSASYSWWACVGLRKTFLNRVLQVIQYAAKLIVPFLELRARLQHRAGLRDSPKSTAAEGYAKLSSLLGDSRTLWRIWGQNFLNLLLRHSKSKITLFNQDFCLFSSG